MTVRLKAKQKIKILNTADIYTIMQQVLLRENKIRRAEEHFWVIGLNNQHNILFIELLCLGGQNRIHLDPAILFRMAIYKLAVKIVLVHNHPGGETIPSKADIATTHEFFKAGQLLKLPVLDHLIITEESYFSFASQNMLEAK